MKFIRCEYSSIDMSGKVGMGYESLTLTGPLVEKEYFFRNHLKKICYNSTLAHKYIKDLKIEEVEISEEDFETFKKEKRAVQLCGGMYPCGLYGCKNPDHELYWIISDTPVIKPASYDDVIKTVPAKSDEQKIEDELSKFEEDEKRLLELYQDLLSMRGLENPELEFMVILLSNKMKEKFSIDHDAFYGVAEEVFKSLVKAKSIHKKIKSV